MHFKISAIHFKQAISLHSVKPRELLVKLQAFCFLLIALRVFGYTKMGWVGGNMHDTQTIELFFF